MSPSATARSAGRGGLRLHLSGAAVIVWSVTVGLMLLAIGASLLKDAIGATAWPAVVASMTGLVLVWLTLLAPSVLGRSDAGLRLLQARLAPLQAVARVHADLRSTIALGWAVPAALLALLAALAPVNPSANPVGAWLYPPAVLAAGVAASLLSAAGWRGWAAAPWMLLWPALLLGVAASGPLQAWRTVAALGWPVHLALLLSLPAALWGVHGHGLQQTGQQPTPAQRLHKLGQGAWIRHWRTLDMQTTNQARLLGLWQQLLTAVVVGSSVNFWWAPWSSTVTAGHTFRLLLLALWASGLLGMRNLHWRWLLAPGGTLRGRMGWHIVRGTLLWVLGMLGVIGGLVLLYLAWSSPATAGRAWAFIRTQLPTLLADLTLAIALATWLRALCGSQLRSGLLLTAVAVVAALACGVLGWANGLDVFSGGPVLWHRGWAHLAGTLMCAAGLTVLANHAWARADLTDVLRSRLDGSRASGGA